MDGDLFWQASQQGDVHILGRNGRTESKRELTARVGKGTKKRA